MPQTYADFLKHPEWAGKIAIDGTDDAWLYAIYQQYGADAARKLVTDIVTKFNRSSSTAISPSRAASVRANMRWRSTIM